MARYTVTVEVANEPQLVDHLSRWEEAAVLARTQFDALKESPHPYRVTITDGDHHILTLGR